MQSICICIPYAMQKVMQIFILHMHIFHFAFQRKKKLAKFTIFQADIHENFAKNSTLNTLILNVLKICIADGMHMHCRWNAIK